MRRRKKLIALIFTTILMLQNIVFAQNTVETTYNYNWWGNGIEDIPFFELYKTIDKEAMGDITLSGVDDVTVVGDRIYMIDTTESRLNIFSTEFELIESVKVVRNAEGKIAIDPATKNQVAFKNPEGVFIHEPNNEIYVADTGNERIVVLNEDDFTLKRIITRPSNMVGQTSFKPSKIAVDRINRIYVIVQSGFEGIIELTSEGEFSRYFGVNKPRVNLIDHFWRNLASEEQKAKMQKVLAPSFNNIEIDDEGFIYATTFDTSAQDMVFRLNPKGENVLRENGFWKVRGDLIDKTELVVTQSPSKFVDIAITDYGTYALLDKNNGRIFIYNFDGELLNVFGKKGFMKGELNDPTSLAWLGNNLIVADKQMKCAYIYKPTHFGELALEAAEAYYKGEWDKSTELLKEAVSINGNFETAYTTIGKSYLMQEDYETAMYYFKLGNNREEYSKAFNGYRSIWIQEHFGFIFTGMILVVVIIAYSEYRYYKKQRK